MCELCLTAPCRRGCPNAPDPPLVGFCDKCGISVFCGDECYTDGDTYLCMDCVNSIGMVEALGYASNVDVPEFLELEGFKLKTLEIDEEDELC